MSTSPVAVLFAETGDVEMIGILRRARLATWSAHGILLVTVSWVLTAALGLVIIGTVTRQHGAPATRSGGSLPLPNLVQPLVNAQKTTAANASAAVSFPVPLPNAVEANQGNLTQAWVNSEQHQVALVFDGGKLTIMMWPATYQDPVREFQTFIAENDATAVVGQVNGQPALVIQPGTDVYKSNPAWVEFERNGTDINVASTSYGTDTLLAVANSMQ
jgi:hypothetical protein